MPWIQMFRSTVNVTAQFTTGVSTSVSPSTHLKQYIRSSNGTGVASKLWIIIGIQLLLFTELKMIPIVYLLRTELRLSTDELFKLYGARCCLDEDNWDGIGHLSRQLMFIITAKLSSLVKMPDIAGEFANSSLVIVKNLMCLMIRANT